MSSIGGASGIGGPKGPGGPHGVDELAESSGAEGAEPIDDARSVDAARAASSPEVDALAAELAAGRLTPQQAVERMVDHVAGGAPLGAAERAELREMLTDLIANDPHLGGLVGRL